MIQVRKVLLVVIGGLILAASVMYASWRYGRIVVESGDYRIRKIPISSNWVAIPGTVDFCYVVEVGRYPFVTTFRVGWDSYEAENIHIKHPAKGSSVVEIDFDELYKVRALIGGDIQSAEWHTQ